MFTRAVFLGVFLCLCVALIYPSELEYAGSGLWNNRNEIYVSDGYAYCAMTNGIQIVDIDPPTDPHVESQIFLNEDATSITISDGRLFLGLRNGNIQVFEMSGPLELSPCGEFGTDHGHIYEIEIKGHLAYVACKAGLEIIDISNPCSPIPVSFFPTGRFAVTNLAIVNDTVYACDVAVWVIDVSQPASPTLITCFEVAMSAWDIGIIDGFAFVSGRDEVQPGIYSWLSVFDLTELDNSRVVSYAGVPSNIYDLDNVGERLYLAADRNGVCIYDISNPSELTEIGSIFGTGLTSHVLVQNDLLYINNFRPIRWDYEDQGYARKESTNPEINPSGDFVIVDVSDVSNPEEIGRVINPGHVSKINIHDSLGVVCSKNHHTVMLVRIGEMGTMTLVSTIEIPGYPQAAVTEGNHIYVAALYDGLVTIDITDCENPKVVGQFNTEGVAYDIKVDGDYAYIADGGNGLGVIDISNPMNPMAVDWLNVGVALNIELSGSNLFVSCQGAGLKVYDASDPEHLVLLSTFPEESDGIWRTYMSIDDDVLCISANNVAVEVIDISNPSSPTLLNIVFPSREIYELAYKDGLLAMAYAWRGAELIDISDIHNQVSRGRYEIGCALDVGFSDDYLFVADTYSLLCFKLPITTDVEHEPALPLPTAYSLKQNFPNPFNEGTTIEFSLDRRQRVQIHILNIAGQNVATLLDKTLDPGPHQVSWDGRTAAGHAAASGMYLYQVAGEKEAQTKKMLLLK